jgi:hypothetical protein
MIWLIIGNVSHQIISCNVHEEDGVFQLWVTRPNGKNLKIEESTDKAKILEIKDAIDFAIEHKEPALRLA